MLIKSVPLVVDKYVWRVKERNLSFWWDKWMDSGPICQNVQISYLPFLKIKDCMVEHSWNVDLVVQLVGQEVADDIFSRVDGTKTRMDMLIWLGSDDSLSVDERIRRIGISLVSKCECCTQGGFEDLNHVLYSGKVKYWLHWVGLRLRESGNLHHHDQAILEDLNLPVVSLSKRKFIAFLGRSRI
ncbi:hypothetical protein SLA2020_418130 [Shorea laevis]